MKLSSHMGKAQGKWLAATKKRLQAIESLLGSIKSSKMMGLTTRLLKVIRGLREAEIQSSFPYRNLNLSSIVLCERRSPSFPMKNNNKKSSRGHQCHGTGIDILTFHYNIWSEEGAKSTGVSGFYFPDHLKSSRSTTRCVYSDSTDDRRLRCFLFQNSRATDL